MNTIEKFKKQKILKAQNGTKTYYRPNGNPVAFDEDGNLTDQVTNEKGTMILPDVNVRGNNYYYNKLGYNSAYHPEDSLDFINAMTAGGLNNLSPTQWLRRGYDLKNLASGNMSFSDYSNRWIYGNEGLGNSYLNLAGDAVVLGGLANPRMIAKGTYYGIHSPEIIQMGMNVAKTNSNPLNWRNYKFIGDKRFYKDLDNIGIKQLLKERNSGNYPITFTERRNYVTNLKNDIQKGIDYAKQEAINNVTTPIKKEIVMSPDNRMFNLSKVNSYSDIQITPHFGTLKATKQYGQTPWEGDYGAFQNSKGLFFPFRDKNNTLRTHSMFQDVGGRIGTGAHEARHTIQSYFDVPLTEKLDNMPGSYKRFTNRKLPVEFKKQVNEFINDARTAGEWEGSLSEMDAELTGWGIQYGIPSKYSLMTPQQKAKIYDLFQRRFGGNSDYRLYNEIRGILNTNNSKQNILNYERNIDNSKIAKILQGLEGLGYRKRGGKMNIVDFLKNGSGIHIKKSHKGLFTK